MLRKLLSLILLFLFPPAYSQINWGDATPTGNIVDRSSFEACQIFQDNPQCGNWQNTGSGDWGKYPTSSKEFLFSDDITLLWQNVDISIYNADLFRFSFQFDLNSSCKNNQNSVCNSIGGPSDYFSARLYFYNADGLYDTKTYMDGPFSNSGWQHFTFNDQIQNEGTPFTDIKIEFSGQDMGNWSGFYGPRLDNPTLSLEYFEVKLAPDCSIDPANIDCIIQSYAINAEDSVNENFFSVAEEPALVEENQNNDIEALLLSDDNSKDPQTYSIRNRKSTQIETDTLVNNSDGKMNEEETTEDLQISYSTNELSSAKKTDEETVAEQNVNEANKKSYSSVIEENSDELMKQSESIDEEDLWITDSYRFILSYMQKSNISSDQSIKDKEQAGVFSNSTTTMRKEENAANSTPEQQQQIAENYMEADQTGVLIAISSDADISTYKNTIVPDNTNWYISKTIYKNNNYKDNVRNIYFLQKESSDKYKEMVDEQYK